MGVLTLKRFRSLILANPLLQGQADIDNELVNDWINLGYGEVTGAVQFEELEHCATLVTIDGTSEYLMPTSFVAITSIQDQTTGAKLNRISLRELHRRTFDTSGYPTSYARKGRGVILWPIPDYVYSFHAFFVKDFVPLTADTDTTILPATWDKAVLLFGMENALRNYNQFDAADKDFMRAIQNMRSRLLGEDLNEPMEGPVRIARSESDYQFNRPESTRF